MDISKQELVKFLSSCQLSKAQIDIIRERCESVREFQEKRNDWASFFQLSEDDEQKVLKLLDAFYNDMHVAMYEVDLPERVSSDDPSRKDLADLLLICQIDNVQVDKICKRCHSLDQFYDLRAQWTDLFQLSRDEKKIVLCTLNAFRLAENHMRHLEDLGNVSFNPADGFDFDRFFDEHREEIEKNIEGLTRDQTNKIYKMVYSRCTSKSSSAITVLSGSITASVPILAKVMAKLVVLSRSAPGVFGSLVSSNQELFNITREISLSGTIVLNVYGAAGAFALLTAISFTKNYRSFIKKEITGKVFWTQIAVDAAANFCSAGLPAASGSIGAVISSLVIPIPAIGIILGSLIGSIVGLLVSKCFVEARIRKIITDNTVDKEELENLSAEQLYKQALDDLNVCDSSNRESIFKVRQAYLLALHPDKKIDSPSTEAIAKMIKCERSFKIIETYRRDRNRW